MELMQLEMFVAVAEEQSFLRAAERVFRTQPAVSIGLRKLEGRIGVPLLDRSNRRSGRLTPAGERLYEYAQKILGLRDEALSVVKGEESHPEGTLHIQFIAGARTASADVLCGRIIESEISSTYWIFLGGVMY